jgi:glutathione S-transferase
MALTFYHGHGSPYSWRAWLALEVKKIPYELKVLSFSAGDTKKPEFVAINPRHQVPTIVDEGFTLWESGAILEYLDERFGGPKLYPGDVKQRSRVRRLVKEAESYLGPEALDVIMDEYFFKGDAAPDLDKVAKARDKLAAELEYFAKELRGDYFDGAAITAADIVVYPYIAYMKRLTVRKPETKLTELLPAPLQAWAKRIESQPWFEQTFPPHWK